MKYIRKYVALALLLGITYIVTVDQREVAGELIETAAGYFPDTLWNPYIVDSVNESPISLYVDDEEIAGIDLNLYMDEKRDIRVAVECLQDIFYCAVNEYEDSQVTVEKNDVELTYRLTDAAVSVNGVEQESEDILLASGEQWYMRLIDVAEWFGYEYTWDVENNAVSLISEEGSRYSLPSAYDYRDKQKSTTVKDQGSYGTCWALASLGALETTLLPTTAYEFAPDHMSIHNAFNLTQNEGGDYTMAMAYLTSWQGPVLEADDPYGDGISPDGLEAVLHVQEIQLPRENDYEGIKRAVFMYGAVQSSIYMALDTPYSESVYYNKDTYSYCYDGEEESNHDIIIIGWDDEYSHENFNGEIEEDGAFICQNSWGEEFGDAGVFYISYADVKIGMHNAVYTVVEENDNYDNIYQADLCGWVGQIGYGSENAYFSNAYVAGTEEILSAVGFYATGYGTSYSIYLVSGFEDESSFENMQYLQSGEFENAGYYTVKLEDEIVLAEGEKFAVVIEIETPGVIHPVAIEFIADSTSENVDLTDGEGYISYTGDSWENTESKHSCNICLKVYTKER